MIVSRVKPSADAWPRTISSLGRRTCGASPRSTPSTSPAWRMCSTSMPSSLTQAARGLLRRPHPAHRRSAPADPGRTRTARKERFDYEYRRSSTVNLFVFVDAHRSWRRVKVTDRRTADDFALCMRELVDVDPQRPSASASSSITSPPTPLPLSTPHSHRPKRAACSGSLEFHYTPKHASWLNMVEIEIGVAQRPMSRSPHRKLRPARCEIDVWQSQRNQSGAQINWMFSTDKARTSKWRVPIQSLAQRAIISVQRN